MNRKSLNIFFGYFFIVLFPGLTFYSMNGYAQCLCTPVSSFPAIINGIVVTESNTGSVSDYGATYTSCGLSAGPMWIGQFGVFNETYTFSSPVNNVNVVISAASGNESFSFSVNAGILMASQCAGTCPFIQVGNTFSNTSVDDGTLIVLTSTTPFTSFTVSGPGGSNGSLIGICSESFSACITPTLTITPSASVCLGGSSIINVSGAFSYTWSPVSSLSGTTTSTVIATPLSTTSYSVIGAIGTCTNSAVTTITVLPSPTLSITSSSSDICSGKSSTLTATGAAFYTWSPGLTLSSITSSIVVATPQSSITYSLIGSIGTCTASTTHSLNVVLNPTVSIAPIAASICSGSSLILSATGATSYIWSPTSSLSSSTASVVTASPTIATTYTLIGANGTCTDSITQVINVLASPVVSIIPASTVICSGNSSVLNATGASSYTWTPSLSLSSSGGSVVTASPLSTTIYTLIGSNGICTDSVTQTLNVIITPTVTIVPTSTSICSGAPLTLMATGATSYIWSPISSLSSATTSVVTASPMTLTTYTIIGANGICTDSSTQIINVLPSPTVSIIPSNTTICSGNSSVFNATGAPSYTWTPSLSLSSSSGSVVTASPLSTTIYTLIGSNGTCKDSVIQTLNVIITPTVTIVPSSAGICSGLSSSLTVTGASSYTWSPASTLSSSNASVVIASPTTTTTYSVSGANGTCTGFATQIITVFINPTVSIVPSTTFICSGTSSALNASGAASYTWSPSLTLSSSISSVVIASPLSTIIYTVIGGVGICTNSAVCTVSVMASPIIAITPTVNSICSGTSSILVATGASSYTWSPASSINSTSASAVTASPLSSTTYTVIGSNGISPYLCSSSNTMQLIVIPNPSITIGPPQIICEGNSTPIYASGADAYSWLPLAGISHPNYATTNVTPPGSGIYVYTVTGTSNNCTGTATVELMVNPVPIVNAGLDVTINPDDAVVLIGTGNTNVGFLSPSGAPLSCNYCDSISVSPQENTCYTLEGINSFGCRNTDDVCVTVIMECNIFIPNVFTPNGDKSNDFFKITTKNIKGYQCLIYNRWGILVFNTTDINVSWDGKIGGELANEGTYFYMINATGNDEIQIKKQGSINLFR